MNPNRIHFSVPLLLFLPQHKWRNCKTTICHLTAESTLQVKDSQSQEMAEEVKIPAPIPRISLGWLYWGFPVPKGLKEGLWAMARSDMTQGSGCPLPEGRESSSVNLCILRGRVFLSALPQPALSHEGTGALALPYCSYHCFTITLLCLTLQ